MAEQLDGETELCQFLQSGVRCEGELVAYCKVGVGYNGRRRFWRKLQSRLFSRWESRAFVELASEEELGEDEYFVYSEPEYLCCDVVYEYQQYQAVEEVASVEELVDNALDAGLSTPAGEGFLRAIVERVLDGLRAVPACDMAAAQRRVLRQWHPDKHEGDLRKELAEEVFKAVKPVMDAQAVSLPASSPSTRLAKLPPFCSPKALVNILRT